MPNISEHDRGRITWCLKTGLLSVLLLVASGTVAGPIEDADAALQRGDYSTALKIYRTLAGEGSGKPLREVPRPLPCCSCLREP